MRRKHNYANGGKIVKSETDTDYVYPKPTFGEAVGDRVKGFFTRGAAGKAGEALKKRESLRDKQIREAGG